MSLLHFLLNIVSMICLLPPNCGVNPGRTIVTKYFSHKANRIDSQLLSEFHHLRRQISFTDLHGHRPLVHGNASLGQMISLWAVQVQHRSLHTIYSASLLDQYEGDTATVLQLVFSDKLSFVIKCGIILWFLLFLISGRTTTCFRRPCFSTWRQNRTDGLHSCWVVPTRFDHVARFRRWTVWDGFRLEMKI